MSSQRPCSVQENYRTPWCAHWGLLEPEATPWHLIWTPCALLGLHATARTLSILKVRAVARRSDMRRAICRPTPQGRGSSAVRTPTAPREAKFLYVKGSHRPRPLTRLRRSLIDKTPPITLIRTRRMRIDEFVYIMAVGDRWRFFY